MEVVFDLGGMDLLRSDLERFRKAIPMVLEGAVIEIGLFIEREAKLVLTRKGGVDTGRLRASIGHGEGPGAGDGVWREEFERSVFTVWVGTNVEYAPYMEYGFTMSEGRTVFIKNVGFRYVHPFSFRGYHYMEEAAEAAQRMATKVVERRVDRALRDAGLA